MPCRPFVVCLIVLLGACGDDAPAFVDAVEANVVYGEDDRIEVYAHPDEGLARIARESVVAIVPNVYMRPLADGGYSVRAPTLRASEQRVCGDEVFAHQEAAAACSGVLIADDLVLTAAHCVDPLRCELRSFVFNYLLEGPNQYIDFAPISENQVYSCKRIVLDSSPASDGDATPDFAVVELDRPVASEHAPAKVRSAVPLTVGDSVAMIGASAGLPLKIDTGGSVFKTRPDHYVCNFDAFLGSSGSAVFDGDNRLAGILVSGRFPDYVLDPDARCTRVNTFDDSEAGEIVQDVATIFESLCEVVEGRDELCDGWVIDQDENPVDAPSPSPPVDAPSPSPPVDDDPNVSAPPGDGCSVASASNAPVGAFVAFLLWVLAVRFTRFVTWSAPPSRHGFARQRDGGSNRVSSKPLSKRTPMLTSSVHCASSATRPDQSDAVYRRFVGSKTPSTRS